MSADNKDSKNVEAGRESLVDSFNKHYDDYLKRYSTNVRPVEPVIDPELVVDSSTVDPSIGEGEFVFTPEVEEIVFVEPENADKDADKVEGSEVLEGDTADVSEVEEGGNVPSQPVELVIDSEEPLGDEDEDASDLESSSKEGDVTANALTDIKEEEGEDVPSEETEDVAEVVPFTEDEDFYFAPEDTASIEEEDELGFYDPNADSDKEPESEPAPQPQTIIEREVVREVLVVDREQARDLGYGSDQYNATPQTYTPAPAPAPVVSTPQPSQPAQQERPSASQSPSYSPSPVVPAARPNSSYSPPAPVEVERQVTIRDRSGVQPRQPEVSRTAEKGGFFGNLFKKNKDSSGDISAYVSDVSEYKERSRIKEEGMDAEFLGTDGGEESNVISLKTQEDYDPREERRRLQHIGFEQRADVDPAVWLEQTMLEALKEDASDLHITVEGDTKNLRARIRVDGQMREFDYIIGVPAKVIMGRLKAATKLSSGGSYAPEETIYELELDGEKRKARAVLFRVEDGGEALVMRLPLTGSLRTLDELAFSDENLQHVLDLLAMPYKLIMIAGPMGSGKGSPAWERILTPSGWTTYGEVQVGDMVVGSDGVATEVTGVFPRGELDVFNVSFNDGSSVTVDGDHLWAVQTPDDSDYRTLSTGDLRSELTSGNTDWVIPIVKPVEFVSRESSLAISPYEFGTSLRSTGDGTIPEDFLFASIEDRLILLRGLLDSSSEFSTVNSSLADSVVFLVRSLGGIATVAKGENNTCLVQATLPHSGGNLASRAISSIEPAGRDEVICIQVAAENSLYVADHFLVTHNTTTAHGALLHVADPTRTVWTIEDPVERRLPNLVQLEIDEENGAGFDVLLAKLLRADYNTLFLGEIRDNDTASAAVRQAKAGRQVMSTIHADDNIKSLMRLIELAGDSPMSVLSAVGGVISQRLVRRLNTGWDGVDLAKKYKGRIPIHEILFINDNIVEVMMQDRPLSEIKQAVRVARGSTFADDARRLIGLGITDREEVVKVIGDFEAEDRY